MTRPVADRLAAALDQREALLCDLPDTDALRLVHSEADGFPGVTVDRLGPALLVERHREGAEVDALLDALVACFGEPQAVFLKERWSRDKRARSGRQVRGAPCDDTLIVSELGLRFRVRLRDDEHVGLFLDGRPARQRVRALAPELRVLNLFAYTGGFGIAAAAGGACSTTNVDSKRSAIEHARDNYALNDLPSNSRSFLRDDVVRYLTRAAKGRGRYDLIVLDPPPNSRGPGGRKLDAAAGYPRLAARCLGLLDPGGYLLAGLNARFVDDAGFDALLAEASEIAGCATTRLDTLGPGPYFPPSSDRPAARFALLRLDA